MLFGHTSISPFRDGGILMRLQSILLTSLLVFASSVSAARTWIHPGTLDGKAELDYVKTQVALKAAPYMFEMQTIKYNEGGLATAPGGVTTIDANGGTADLAKGEGRRAYGNALLWYLTDSVVYAERAIAILNSWSGLQSITAIPGNQQNLLVAGWVGSLFGPAADIMLGYPGWAAADIAKVRAMFERAFYPVLKTASTWNGNVDLHQTSALMAIAVFNENEAWFNEGIARLAVRVPAYFYLKSDGALPPSIAGDNGSVTAFWSNPTQWLDGLTQETCRDNNHHAQFGMSGALGAMETAWHQGVDVYTTYQTRMVAVMELMGLQGTSGSMQGACTNNQTTSDVYDTWEIGYNHYKTRKGVNMPNTLAMLTTKVRLYASNPGSWNIFYETLTHANIVYANGGDTLISGGGTPSSIKAIALNGMQVPWNMSLQGETLVLNAAPGELTKVSITDLLGNQRKVLFAGLASGSLSLAFGNGMPSGRYILTVQVGHQARQLPVSVLGH
jgi:hypothetical protein